MSKKSKLLVTLCSCLCEENIKIMGEFVVLILVFEFLLIYGATVFFSKENVWIVSVCQKSCKGISNITSNILYYTNSVTVGWWLLVRTALCSLCSKCFFAPIENNWFAYFGEISVNL